MTEFQRDLIINGISFALVAQTRSSGLVATTAFHREHFDRSIGGIRLLPGTWESNREVAELAEAMTWKAPLVGIPASGQKTTVFFGRPLPPEPEARAQAVADHLADVIAENDGATFGPDMNCDEEVMRRLAETHGLGEHVVGLPLRHGGLSIDRQGFTAHGLAEALRAAAARFSWPLEDLTVSIQGFGAVGASLANLLFLEGIRVVGISSAVGMLYSSGGLDIEPLYASWRAQERERDFFPRYAAAAPDECLFDAEPNRLMSLAADIFVPAARTDVLATADEIPALESQGQPNAEDVARFARATGVRLVLEGANHPLSADAETYLSGEKVVVLPDYLVNCGGLVGCWADWIFREDLLDLGDGFSRRLKFSALRQISRIVNQNVLDAIEIAPSQDGSLRAASLDLAERRRSELLARYQTLTQPDPRSKARWLWRQSDPEFDGVDANGG